MTKIITKSMVRENYDMKEIMHWVEQYYRLESQKKISLAPRHFVPTLDGGDLLYGAVMNLENKTCAVESSPFMPWLSKELKPVVQTNYLYQSFGTGELLAVVNGIDVIKLRTGAKSALAAGFLARKDSKILGLIGLGAQAETQAEALCKVLPIERIVGFTRNPELHESSLKYIHDKTGLSVEQKTIDEVVHEADVIVVATHSKEPLFSFSDLRPGQTMISLDHAESIHRDIVAKADKTFVDRHETAQNELGPVKIALDNGWDYAGVKGELIDLIDNRLKGRESDDEIIYFQSLGVMHENLATVEYLYDLLKDKAENIALDI